jgi:predicted DNA-binding protein with PD1-like motif
MNLDVRVLRLSPGEDLRARLEVERVPAGCIVSAVGSFSRAVLRFAAEDKGAVIDGPTELIALSGTLSEEGVHLHAAVADAQGDVKAGHVMPGCIVRTTAEVVIAVLPEWEFRRVVDEATGYKELAPRKRDS